MPAMRSNCSLLLSTLCLSACVSKPIKLTASSTNHEGIITQSIVFKDKKAEHQWVCFTEVIGQVVQGISCQSDTALPLFSGGLVNDKYEFEYPSRFLLKIQPQNMLVYIKMSLFDRLTYDLSALEVSKEQNHTFIIDHKRKFELSITTL